MEGLRQRSGAKIHLGAALLAGKLARKHKYLRAFSRFVPGRGSAFLIFADPKGRAIWLPHSRPLTPNPAIRLKGRWLERAGFPPNSRVTVILRSQGVLEIQARAA